MQRLLERAGRRAEDFHALQLERLDRSPDVVELDELHTRVCKPPASADAAAKKGRRRVAASLRSRMGSGLVDAVAAWAEGGFTSRW